MSEPDRKRPRRSHLRWVRLGDIRVPLKAQREFRPPHAESLAANFDLEALGFPVVNMVDDDVWVLDGQHRLAALTLCGFSEDDLIQCECYEGLTEPEMAELFLLRDERKAISTFDKFRIGVVADREVETDIERIVRTQGYRIAKSGGDGSIGAVAALRFGYKLGASTLGRAIRILGTAFDGDRHAFSSDLIKGMSLVCERYNGELDEERAVERLAALRGGPKSLERSTNQYRLQTGHAKPHCAAGAIVDAINKGRRAKLESWWS